MRLVKNKLTVYGSVSHLTCFIEENFVDHPCRHYDGNGRPNYFLHFKSIHPVPEYILKDSEKAVSEWKKVHWGTDRIYDHQTSSLKVNYKHSYDYTEYFLDNTNELFNSYSIFELGLSANDIYKDNMDPDENELTTIFFTDWIPSPEIFKLWIERYQFSTLKFRLDFWEVNDMEFAGSYYYDYFHNIYLSKLINGEEDLLGYINYTLENSLITIDEYSYAIANKMIEKDPNLQKGDIDKLIDSILDIIEDEKNVELIDVARSIFDMLKGLNK